jgi:hypothetical protein
VPESKSRKKASYTPPPESKALKPNPTWFVPVMLGLMIAGLVWIVTYYVTSSSFPIPGISHFNLVIGFVLILTGFGMMTRWR